MEAAGIGWLAQEILSHPLISKPPDPWVREAGLAEEIDGLTSAIKQVRMVVSAVEGRELGNEPVAESLVDLKEVLYDAANVVDDLDYYKLKQGKPADIPPTNSSRGRRQRSKAWDHFVIIRDDNGKAVEAECKYCHTVVQCKTTNGTGVLSRHIKSAGCRASHQPQDPSLSIGDATGNGLPVSVGNSSSRKRMRIDDEPTQVITDNAYLSKKDEFSIRLRQIISQLKGIQRDMSGVLNILGFDSATTTNHRQSTTSDPCRRTSSLVQREMYGRAAEKKSIINLIREHKSAAGVTVVPIVGIGGVGKTSLVQHVYNDPAVENQFDIRIWIWVSNIFDEVRLTREMLDFVSEETHQGLCSFAKLQEVLKTHIKSKRLLAPFRSDRANNNLIIMTTRKPYIAKRRGTVEPIKLGALEKQDFWLLFKACAFGDENYEEKESLRDIAHKMAQKLKGNPLAAQTAGALLREHLTVEHWTNNLQNEYWKSLQLCNGIMPALKLCYDELPYHLQQCYSYCSIFPYNYLFHAEELVRMWISRGFVKPDYSSRSLEEMGRSYLSELVNLGFFEQVEENEENISRSEKFEEKVRVAFTSVKYLRVNQTHLRYLKLEGGDVELGSPSQVKGKLSHEILDGWLTSLQIIHLENCGEGWILPCLERLPFLTRLKLCKMRELREVSVPSLEELVLVEMLELENCVCTSLGDMNSSLRLLEIRGCPALKKFDLLEKHHSFKMENNTWLPSLTKFVICDCPHLQILAPLRPLATLSELLISRVSMFLTIDGYSMETFEIRPNSLLGDSSGEMRLDHKILAFHNLRDLKHLEIKGCRNLVSISLISFSHLVSLESLSIDNCTKLFSSDILSLHTHEELIATGYNALPYLESLSIVSCGITGKWLSMMLRHALAMKELVIKDCPKLTKLQLEGGVAARRGRKQSVESGKAQDGLWCVPLNVTSSLKKITICKCPTLTFDGRRKGFAGFTSLEYLKIEECPELFSSLVHGRLLLPRSLEEIAIDDYSQETLQPCFLNNHTCLKHIAVCYSQSLISLMLHSCTSLEDLTIRECKWLGTLHGMESLGTIRSLGLHGTSSLEFLQLESFTLLEDLHIVRCTSLVTLEGLLSLLNLKHLVVKSPTTFGVSYELTGGILPRLESLEIDDLSRLTTSFYKGLTCLQRLQLYLLKEKRLTDDQEIALLLHRSLQHLQFFHCLDLVDLPAGLHSLPSLKMLEIERCPISELPKEGLPPSLEKLYICGCDDLVDLSAGLHRLPSLKAFKIRYCKRISELPKEGLPPSLEELEITGCCNKLSEQCRLLTTSKLRVKIDDAV
ncbi:putative disease resistance protein RGA4 [Triticum dicoccoides]|uniref:putative disease resistance protein RGA4 n=1 Tax=Triticum dicoccoides TaxID=85692 RepID=UPI00189185A2|nr:putative disease resistance protein RGA4 [Triticum dicoccoides]